MTFPTVPGPQVEPKQPEVQREGEGSECHRGAKGRAERYEPEERRSWCSHPTARSKKYFLSVGFLASSAREDAVP